MCADRESAVSPNGPRYRAGQKLRCPHCGQDSVVKVERRMQGWKCVGEHWACALCHANLGPADACSAAAHARTREVEGLSKAASLFGEPVPARPVNPLMAEGGRNSRFCRDCRHFLKHPFICRCLLHDRRVEPMSDCSAFERAPVSKSDAGPPVNE